MSRRQIPNVVASVLLLASVVVGLVRIANSDGSADADLPRGATEAAAMLAARTSATGFFTLDPAKVNQQVDDVLAAATGVFLREYSANRDALVADVVDRKRTVTALVPRGGTAIASFSLSKAVVLVAVDATSKERAEAAATKQYRLVLTMVRSGATWKTATLDQLQPVAGAGEFKAGTLPGGNKAVTAATANAVAHMLSSDYRTLDADLASTLPLLTGSFGFDFARSFDESVRVIATRKKAVTDAYVRAVGLVARDGDKARCLVFVDQVLNPKGAADVTDVRLFADLRLVNGHWLVDALSRA